MSWYSDDGDLMKCTELKAGMRGRIHRIHMSEKDQKRLLVLGIYEGAPVKVERNEPRSGLLILLVCGNFLMLRHRDAEKIEVIQDEENRICR